jgi:hypothetical protein
MPRIFKITKIDIEKRRKELSDQFPGARFGSIWDICPEAMETFRSALSVGSEEAIQRALTNNPYLIQYAIPHSGHHGIWVFPKPMIKPPTLTRSPGLIPDYLVVTRSSLGYFWHIVEIKRYDIQFASSDGRSYSRDGQRAIAQCNRYLVHFQDYIEAVRANIRIGDLIQPQGAILLIGNSEAESEEQRQCRANFVRTTPKIDVVSYQRILGSLQSDLGSRKRIGHHVASNS